MYISYKECEYEINFLWNDIFSIIIALILRKNVSRNFFYIFERFFKFFGENAFHFDFISNP
jgi:hypothetical protein